MCISNIVIIVYDRWCDQVGKTGTGLALFQIDEAKILEQVILHSDN